MLSYHSDDVGDAVHVVWLAVAWPVVQEVVNINLELLHVIVGQFGDVVLQVIYGGQLMVRHDAPFLVLAPEDARGEPDEHTHTEYDP